VSPLTILMNVLLFQAAWFAGVLGAARGSSWLGVVVAAGVIAWHLGKAQRASREFVLLVVALAVGLLFENLLVRAGWLRFDPSAVTAGAAPLWMVTLWAVFATTLNVSMRLLHGRPLAGAAMGAIAAPLAYYAGSRLGAVEMVDAPAALAAISAGWLFLTPALVAAARRLDGYAPR